MAETAAQLVSHKKQFHIIEHKQHRTATRERCPGCAGDFQTQSSSRPGNHVKQQQVSYTAVCKRALKIPSAGSVGQVVILCSTTAEVQRRRKQFFQTECSPGAFRESDE